MVTGIVVADTERLVLRPLPVALRRGALLRLVLGFAVMTVVVAVSFAHLFAPHVTYGRAVAVAAIVAVLYGYRFSTQITFVATRFSDGIYVETKNRILRTRKRRLLHAYADIDAVLLRSRVNPNAALPSVSPMGAYLHYDVVIDTGGTTALLWYTRYPECAVLVAKAIARFAKVPVIDHEGIAESANANESVAQHERSL